MCFICKTPSHAVDDCPVRKRPRHISRYIGSGAPGLGFYHFETHEVVVKPITSTKNCGVVLVQEGHLTIEELLHEFSRICKTNWMWKLGS